MKDTRKTAEEKIGRPPDASSLTSVWTEKGWERSMEMYWITSSREKTESLCEWAETFDEVSVDAIRMKNGDTALVLRAELDAPLPY